MDIDALHSALLSITVVSEKVRAAREILSATGDAPARLGKFLCEAENDLRMAQATLGGELGFSLCPRCWSRQTWTASLIVPSVDEFRTSKRRELRDRRQPAIDCPSWLRSAQAIALLPERRVRADGYSAIHNSGAEAR